MPGFTPFSTTQHLSEALHTEALHTLLCKLCVLCVFCELYESLKQAVNQVAAQDAHRVVRTNPVAT